MVKNFGQTILFLLEYTNKARKMVGEHLIGVMEQNMKDSLLIIQYMVMESMYGQIRENILVNGKIIKWMGEENFIGQMEKNI